MNEYIHDRINSVIVKNDNSEYEFKYVTSFDEYDHEIVVESSVQIEGLQRGYVGDLFYHTRGVAVKDLKTECTSVVGFKDVLLARVVVSAQPGQVAYWRYNFLKD